jgi:serine/threonine protein kinase
MFLVMFVFFYFEVCVIRNIEMERPENFTTGVNSKETRMKGVIAESLQSKIREQLKLFPQAGKYTHSFKRIELDGSVYLARDDNKVLTLGKIGRKIGEGGYGLIYEVPFLNTEGISRTWALKVGGEADAVIQGMTSLQREVSVIRSINPKKEIPLFPFLNGEVTERKNSQEQLVGYLTELGDYDYGVRIENNPQSSFTEIGREFYDMAQSLALLHRTHMHAGLHERNFLCKGEGIQLIDYGSTRMLDTLWNRTDDDGHDRYWKLPDVESNRFNALPALIEELIESDSEDSESELKLPEEAERLKQACKEEAKAMDVFALGRIFYIRSYGKEPYTATDLMGANIDALVLSSHDKPLPLGLKELIESMLSPKCESRPSMDKVQERLSTIFPEIRSRSNESWIQEMERFFKPLQRADLVGSNVERLRAFNFFNCPHGFLTTAFRDVMLSILIRLSIEEKKNLAFEELFYCQESAEEAVRMDQAAHRVLEGVSLFQNEFSLQRAPDFMKKFLIQKLMEKQDRAQAEEVFRTITS